MNKEQQFYKIYWTVSDSVDSTILNYQMEVTIVNSMKVWF